MGVSKKRSAHDKYDVIQDEVIVRVSFLIGVPQERSAHDKSVAHSPRQ